MAWHIVYIGEYTACRLGKELETDRFYCSSSYFKRFTHNVTQFKKVFNSETTKEDLSGSWSNYACLP